MSHAGTVVDAYVKAGSKAPGISLEGGRLTIRVREPARDGKANEACRRALAKHFGVSASTVRLLHGARSKHKRFVI